MRVYRHERTFAATATHLPSGTMVSWDEADGPWRGPEHLVELLRRKVDGVEA